MQTYRGVWRHAPAGKKLENLDCHGLYFAAFHGRERETKSS